ncbi:uncharacterized protein [Danio rerio]|uniref:Uncharacterized protein n=1 Tax=Danio rerio TaxID=7955 RepID=A0AC58J1A3_DANRE
MALDHIDLESHCCTNCHKLLQKIAVLETKLLAIQPELPNYTGPVHRGASQHSAGKPYKSTPATVLRTEKQIETVENQRELWHKQGARPKGTRGVRSRRSYAAALAFSTPNTARTQIQLQNRYEVLSNMGEDSPNAVRQRSHDSAINFALNRGSRPTRQRHSAPIATEIRTLIVGDSIIKNFRSRDTMTYCFPHATVSDINKELENILRKHETAKRIIIHVGKNDIRKEQSELLKRDFCKLLETVERLKIQPFISGPLPARGTNMFSRLLGLNAWLQKTCNMKRLNFIDNFNLFWNQRQLFTSDGLHPNKLGAKVLKDNILFSLHHPSAVYATELNDTHTPSKCPDDHRTSNQLLSGLVADASYKDRDNTTQPQQPPITDKLPSAPCTLSSTQADCDASEQHQVSALIDDPQENSQVNISQQPETPDPQPLSPDTQPLSPDTFSLSSCSPLLDFSKKMEELVCAGTKLSHSIAASPQLATKSQQATRPSLSPPRPTPRKGLRSLRQRQVPKNTSSLAGELKNCH